MRVIFEKSETICKLEDVFWKWMAVFCPPASYYHDYLLKLKLWLKSSSESPQPEEVEEVLPKPCYHTFKHRWYVL